MVIGNPPYNAGQVNENDNNKNRKYKDIDIKQAENGKIDLGAMKLSPANLTVSGLVVDENLICYGTFTQQGGYMMSQSIMDHSPRPTAIFAGNNFIAVGVLRALREGKITVPGDMALVAFDDLPPTYVIDPFLTVAAQSAYEMGQKATRLLMQRMLGTAPDEYQEFLLSTRLIVRQSSGDSLSDSRTQ